MSAALAEPSTETTEPVTEAQPKKRTFEEMGGITAQEAGRRSGLARREAKLDAESLVVTPRELKRLKRRLLELAEGKHNASPTAQIQAARALQEWVKLSPEQPAEEAAALDREARKARREQLEQAARAESNTSKGAHASSAEQGQSAPDTPAAS